MNWELGHAYNTIFYLCLAVTTDAFRNSKATRIKGSESQIVQSRPCARDLCPGHNTRVASTLECNFKAGFCTNYYTLFCLLCSTDIRSNSCDIRGKSCGKVNNYYEIRQTN